MPRIGSQLVMLDQECFCVKIILNQRPAKDRDLPDTAFPSDKHEHGCVWVKPPQLQSAQGVVIHRIPRRFVRPQ